MKSQALKYHEGKWVSCEPKEATHLRFQMPGPVGCLTLPVMIGGTREGTPNWTWNGNLEAPTLKPSIKTEYKGGVKICHSHLNDGKVKFLDDTTHELKGQTVDLLELEECYIIKEFI